MSRNQIPVLKMVDPEPYKEIQTRPQLFVARGLSLANLNLPESVLIVAQIRTPPRFSSREIRIRLPDLLLFFSVVYFK